MRRGRVLAIGLVTVASWIAMPGAHAAQSTVKGDMQGSEEVPTPGDPDGKGTAVITLDDAKKQACYEFKYENLDKVTAAHIHTGAKGVAGPPVIDFKADQNGDKGCVPVNDPSTMKAISDNPSGYYVNLHTDKYPAGAIRGQLTKG
jgi:hypothetical protein